ncbi:MAG TPA: sigma-70 family RNA polymerase sigma factor [Verrucomicrobiae bacterium]|nr:sigma-70 family RNA polymerase sigma factor [Verrucomicrobiae bacterium]
MERVLNSDADTRVSDQELLKRFRAGDELAFDDLVLRHQQRAFNVAYQLLRDPEDATEVAQDAFVRAYRHLDSFHGECEFTTWLHRIVVNLAHNKHRWWKRRGKQSSVSLDSVAENVASEISHSVVAATDAPDAQAVKAEFIELLHQKMTELPCKFREVLVLRNVENLSYEEIATTLNCSVGTVKSRLARGREALRKSMKNES